MIPTTILSFFLLYYQVLVTSSALTIKTNQFDTMLQKWGKIIASCKSPLADNVGVLRHSESSLTMPTDFFSRASVINLQDSKADQLELQGNVERHVEHIKLHTFVIVTFSPKNLRQLVGKLRNTTWWDPLALYLIFDDRTEKTGCRNAYRLLYTSWDEDLLHTIFFCQDPLNGFTMYSYNPYTKQAPKAWQVIGNDRYSYRNHTWTLLKQKIKDSTTCKDFYLPKTVNLDRYPINVLALTTDAALEIDDSEEGLERLRGPNGLIVRTALAELNPTLNLTVLTNVSDYWGLVHMIQIGKYDLLANEQYIFNKQGISISYPHGNSGLSIATRYPGYKKQLAKLLAFMNPKVLLGMAAVFIVTVIILNICIARGITYATLETLRILLGTSVQQLPAKYAARIYLITVVILFLITGSVFQSCLSSILMIPVRDSSIDNIDDLRNSGFTIYIYKDYKHAITNADLHSRTVGLEYWDCSEEVMTYENAACISERDSLLLRSYEKNLHLSKHRLFNMYTAFIIRSNWPLRPRFDSILSRLNQGGLVSYMKEQTAERIKNKWAAMEAEEAKNEYHVMKLHDLSFAFCILLIGFGLSIAIFLREIRIKRMLPRSSRVC